MTQTATLPRDADGYAPTAAQLGCNRDDCPTCAGLGWVLCHHTGPATTEAGIAYCDGCDAPTDSGTAWAWCPARTE